MLKYRPTNPNDNEALSNWIAADPHHRDTCPASFWLSPSGDSECIAVEDEQGPVFFVRSETVKRLHIQFPPNSEHRRIVVALDQLVKDMKSIGAGRVRQFIFDSVFGPLIKFLKRRGVRHSPDEYVLDL